MPPTFVAVGAALASEFVEHALGAAAEVGVGFGEGFFERIVGRPEPLLPQCPSHEYAHGFVHGVEALLPQLGPVMERSQRQHFGEAPAPVDTRRWIFQFTPQRQSSVEEGAALGLRAIARRLSGDAGTMHRLGGQRPVEEWQRGGHGLLGLFAVGAPARLEGVERLDRGSRARRRSLLSFRGCPSLKRFHNASPFIHPKHVGARPEEHHLEARAVVQIEEQHAVALGGADGLDAPVEGALEQRGDVAPRLAVARAAKDEVKRRPRRDAQHPFVVWSGQGDGQLAAYLRKHIAHHASGEVRRPLSREGV